MVVLDAINSDISDLIPINVSDSFVINSNCSGHVKAFYFKKLKLIFLAVSVNTNSSEQPYTAEIISNIPSKYRPITNSAIPSTVRTSSLNLTCGEISVRQTGGVINITNSWMAVSGYGFYFCVGD